MSFNKITLVGNLGRDPELRYTPQGTPVCSFSLATNERRKDRTTGENNDITTWFRVTLWDARLKPRPSTSPAAGRFTLRVACASRNGPIATASRDTRSRFMLLTCSSSAAGGAKTRERRQRAEQRLQRAQPIQDLNLMT